ncbi:MAG: hypothetical protein RBG13Loki_1539 [Promethearchaeota archaeon CR_4]|nr:MAG: hypothetical protein RBG13Loki_1539 [Candidatus Lokiarchaeota archaeon CR_4]
MGLDTKTLALTTEEEKLDKQLHALEGRITNVTARHNASLETAVQREQIRVTSALLGACIVEGLEDTLPNVGTPCFARKKPPNCPA